MISLQESIQKIGYNTVRIILDCAKQEGLPVGLCDCGIIYIKRYKGQNSCIDCIQKPSKYIIETICKCGCGQSFIATAPNQKYRPQCYKIVRRNQIYKCRAKKQYGKQKLFQKEV